MYLTPFKTAWWKGQSCVSRPQCAVQCCNSLDRLTGSNPSICPTASMTDINTLWPAKKLHWHTAKARTWKGSVLSGHNPLPLDQGQRLSARIQNEMVFIIYLGCITISESWKQTRLLFCVCFFLYFYMFCIIQLMHLTNAFFEECNIAY